MPNKAAIASLVWTTFRGHFCLGANDITRNQSRVIFSRACVDIFRRWRKQSALDLVDRSPFLPYEIYTRRNCFLLQAGFVYESASFFHLKEKKIVTMGSSGGQISPRRAKKDSNIPFPERTRSVKIPYPRAKKDNQSPPHALHPPPPAGITLLVHYKVVNNSLTPQYLYSLLTPYAPTRSLRSASKTILSILSIFNNYSPKAKLILFNNINWAWGEELF